MVPKMRPWLALTLSYVLSVGLIGITSKLSMRYVTWPMLLLSATIAYAGLTAFVAFRGALHIPSPWGPWILFVPATGVLIAGSFLFLILALEKADASQVVPVSAMYPMVTAVLAAAFLGEPLSLQRIAGIILIVAGAILVSR